MTPKEAISILTELWSENLEDGNDKAAKAEALGIKALKLNLTMRETYHAPELLLLPGETEE